MRRRTESERWAGMWDFVRFEIDESTQTLLPFAPPLRKNLNAAVKRASPSDPSSKSKRRSGSKSLFDSNGEQLPQAITDQIRQQTKIDAGAVLASMEFSYSVTRYKVRLLSRLCSSDGISGEPGQRRVAMVFTERNARPAAFTNWPRDRSMAGASAFAEMTTQISRQNGFVQ